jgi:hypothetical protein
MNFGKVEIGNKRKGGVKFDSSFELIDVDRNHPTLGNRHILYNHLDDEERARVIEAYRLDYNKDCENNGPMLEATKVIARKVYKGQNVALMCWCSGPPTNKPCHAEIIKGKIEEILAPFDTKDDPIEFYRAGGDCICPQCNKEYRKHPHSEHLAYDGYPWLRRLCNGDLVKL